MAFLLELFDSEREFLMERQNYMPMFQGFITAIEQTIKKEKRETVVNQIKTEIQRHTVKVSNTFNRADRTTWFLLRSRPLICSHLFKNINNNAFDTNIELEKIYDTIGTYYAKALQDGELASVFKNLFGFEFNVTSNDQISLTHNTVSILFSYLESLEHYFNLEYQPIQNYKLRGTSITKVMSELGELEQKYVSLASRTIKKVNDNDKKLIDFNDGFAWYDLNTPVSNQEATAMGHCCTDTRTQHGGTVYSLRKQTKKGFIPSVTAMVKDGWLYEIKGFRNQKPNPKYHPYLVKLIMSDYVNGMVGGGYKAENNFTLLDLPEVQARELAKQKPNLIEPNVILDFFPEGSNNFWEYIKKLNNKALFDKFIKPKLKQETVKKILEMKPEFMEVTDIERIYGLRSKQMVAWIKGIQDEAQFDYFIAQMTRNAIFSVSYVNPNNYLSKQYGINDVEFVQRLRPDLLNPEVADRLFGGDSPEFKQSASMLTNEDEENDRLFVDGPLTEAAQKIILSTYPDAIDVASYVKIFGAESEIAMSRFKKVSEEIHNGMENLEEHNDKYYYLSAESGNSIEDYIDNFGNDIAKWCYKVISGNDFLHIDYVDMPDAYMVEDWITDEDYNKLLDYIKKEFDEEEIDDIDDKRGIIQFALDEITEFEQAARFAAIDGYEAGTERQIYKTFKHEMENARHPVSETLDARLLFHYQSYEDKKNNKKDFSEKTFSEEFHLDATVWVVIPKNKLLTAFEDKYFHSHWIDYGFDNLKQQEYINIVNPRYGWNEFDNKAAKESFSERFYEKLSYLLN